MSIKNKNTSEDLSSQKMINSLRVLIDNIASLDINLNASTSTKILIENEEFQFQLNIYGDTVESIVLYEGNIELTSVKIELHFITSQFGEKLIISYPDNQKTVFHFYELCEMLKIKTTAIRNLFNDLKQIKEDNITDILFGTNKAHTRQSYINMKTNKNEAVAA